MGTNFTYKIVGKYSTDTNLIGTKFNINNKTHTWSLSDCSKHVKLSRGKNSHCAICTQDSHIDRFNELGTPIVDRLSHKDYIIKLQCGHIKTVQSLSNPTTLCKECNRLNILKRSPDGTVVKKFTKKGQRVELFLPCGHTVVRHSFGDAAVICKECNSIEKQSILAELSIKETSEDHFELPCGHTTGCINWKTLLNYKCPGCERLKIHARLRAFNLKPTGEYNYESRTHEAILECGHIKFLRTTDIKSGVVCPTCSENHYNKPCSLYVITFGCSDGFSFVKIGISNDVPSRIKEYGIKNVITTDIVYSKILATKRLAVIVEKKFHKENINSRINPAIIKNYLKCGFTECYPIEMLADLLLDIKNRGIVC